MQLKYSFKRGIVYLLLFFGFTALLIFLYPRVISVFFPLLGKRNLSKNELCPECQIYFQDKQAKQERAYRNDGIKPQKELNGLDRLKRRRILMVIPDREYFKIDNKMTYSRPYLLPKAISFLDTLGRRYQNRLGSYPLEAFVITSATRSISSLAKLSKTNINTSKSSLHLRGKTFDISYSHFKNDSTRSAFILTLKELKDQKKCFVKYEKNKNCLHITVN
ncbi:MAG: hypothetical protein FJX80_11720 [Bacteroidetes bacterium]|nr:hypothetical protein [Bacteroidota bacterium]